MIENVEHRDRRSHQRNLDRSPGLQLGLACAGAFVKRPRGFFADEATSALDEAAEKTLYERLRTMAAAENGALVSIAHRPSVAGFHDRVWQVPR